jgi:hypothetical protein
MAMTAKHQPKKKPAGLHTTAGITFITDDGTPNSTDLPEQAQSFPANRGASHA